MTWMAPALLCAALAMSSGCATGNVPFRGFGRVADDINSPADPKGNTIPAFPLLYYKEQSHLAVLWPLYENEFGKSLAVRPLFSAYNLDNAETREWNVLWPLVHHEPATGKGRAFPFFWGDNYLVGFPLWWHSRKASGVEDLLIPLWWYERDALNWRFSALLGTIGFENSKDAKGWRIFPLYGDYEFKDGARHRYELLLAHQYHSPGGLSHINTLVPLWWYDSDPSDWKFLTPLWMQGANRHGDSWSLLFPLFFNRDAAESSSFYTLLAGWSSASNSSSWIVPPLLSGGSRHRDGHDNYFIWPLTHFGRDGNNSSSHIFPLYYESTDRRGSCFYSLPWWSESKTDGSNWQLVPPLFYRDEDQEGTLTLSPLYSANRSKRGNNDWHFLPPIFFHGKDTDGSTTLTPLYSCGESIKEQSAWSLLFPLYYRQHDRDGSMFATLLGGITSGSQRDSWAIYPLLTWKQHRGSADDFWMLAPFFHYGSDTAGSKSHIFPLYYSDTANKTFLSLPYSTWKNKDASHSLIPPLLSWQTSRPDDSELWMLGGLARYASGSKAGGNWLLPLFYNNPRKGTAFSPLYFGWSDDGGTKNIIPPLLGALNYNKDGSRDLWALGGLFNHQWDPSRGTLSNWLLPLYAYAPGRHFYTPLAGTWNDVGESGAYYLTPLIGSRREGNSSTIWFMPLYHRSTDPLARLTSGHFLWSNFRSQEDSGFSQFIPFWWHSDERKPSGNADSLTFALLGLYGDRKTETPKEKTSWTYAFPLWGQSSKEIKGQSVTNSSSILLALYDTKHGKAAGQPSDSVRRRVLWEFLKYKREHNGDVEFGFCGFGYGSKADGYRRYSFLHSLFRWQREPDGKRSLDLLFIPVL